MEVFEVAVVVTLALLLDHRLGEPARFHPLVGFGHLARRVEQRLFRGQSAATAVLGIVGWCVMVLPVCVIGMIPVWFHGEFSWVVESVGLYLVIGGRSLAQHATAVSAALSEEGLRSAQQAVGRMVSRQTEEMTRQEIAAATVESVLENGNDAVFAALFWYLLAGLPGAFAYRAVNTLDAMWGYKTPRYLRYGWWSARMDDLLNWIPARLTALSYLALGNRRSALQCWRSQAIHCQSPNGGVVMATGAGALEILLGGRAIYDGQVVEKPRLGLGQPADREDIGRATRLVAYGQWLWLVLLWGAVVLVGIWSG